ncbi:response regulator [Motiliproteus sp. MSK22-1]|uniref:response regulator n=1 Tax=Motiliproteus sp. MSK22-1 TaxID=1897630 RepID=UPI0009769547|nr:response regulator [Motiliproteus sp. MSK22-1]OMH27153.1 hypothetical protein BGP75_22840 [Motiliproteus sp. MSK22-1]
MLESKTNNTLLILDDEPNVLKALKRVLSGSGYNIHAFTRPYDAIEMLQEAEIGVIIADQCMPQMEGDEFLAIADQNQPRAVRIAISGYVDTSFKERATDGKDAWRYLTKPWNDDELRTVVTEAFKRFNSTTGD